MDGFKIKGMYERTWRGIVAQWTKKSYRKGIG